MKRPQLRFLNSNHWVDGINKFFIWHNFNIQKWLAVESHVTCLNQLECFISAKVDHYFGYNMPTSAPFVDSAVQRKEPEPLFVFIKIYFLILIWNHT